jgi:hypothetical protein
METFASGPACSGVRLRAMQPAVVTDQLVSDNLSGTWSQRVHSVQLPYTMQLHCHGLDARDIMLSSWVYVVLIVRRVSRSKSSWLSHKGEWQWQRCRGDLPECLVTYTRDVEADFKIVIPSRDKGLAQTCDGHLQEQGPRVTLVRMWQAQRQEQM